MIYAGKHLMEWSMITGIAFPTLRDRYKRGDRGERLFRRVKPSARVYQRSPRTYGRSFLRSAA